MPAPRYDVVFYGELLEGYSIEQVIKNLSEELRLTEEKAAQLFSAGSHRLKSSVERAAANWFQQVFAEAGAQTVIEPAAMEAENSAAAAESAAQDSDRGSAGSGAEPPDFSSTEDAGTTEEDQRRLPFSFTGEGGEYFRIWIVNLALTVVTLGIYSAWAKVRNNQYFYGNTHLDGASFSYLASPIQILKGRVLAAVLFILYSVLSSFFPVAGAAFAILFLVFFPWLVVRSLAFNAYNSEHRNVRFGFKGRAIDAAVAFIGWPLLAIVTLGILVPYAFYKQQRFLVENYRYGTSGFEFHARASQYYLVFLAILGIAIGGGILAALSGMLSPFLSFLLMAAMYLFLFVYFNVKTTNLTYGNTRLGKHSFSCFMELGSYAVIFVTNTLAIVMTLGLFIPWAKVRMARYRAEHLNMIAVGSLDDFAAAEQEQVSPFGEGMGDVFDFDVGL